MVMTQQQHQLRCAAVNCILHGNSHWITGTQPRLHSAPSQRLATQNRRELCNISDGIYYYLL